MSMKRYVVHSGHGRASRGGELEHLESAEVASLYGLEPEDYDLPSVTAGTAFDAYRIHLTPRPDGIYRNIKIELGDTGEDTHWRKMVNAKDWRRRNRDANRGSSR